MKILTGPLALRQKVTLKNVQNVHEDLTIPPPSQKVFSSENVENCESFLTFPKSSVRALK